MDRRQFTGQLAAGVALWVWAAQARALSLTDADARAGLKAVLERGATAAVSLLGRTDGFPRQSEGPHRAALRRR